MRLFGFLPTGMLPTRETTLPAVMKREVQPISAPVPSSTMEKSQVTGGSYAERILQARDPLTALTVSAVYRAVELRAKTMGIMPVQYRKKDFEKDNFKVDMRGLGKRINYLLQQEPNPIMSASSLWEVVTASFTSSAMSSISRCVCGW